MNSEFAQDYDLESLLKVDTGMFGFELCVTPRFRQRYEIGAYEELTSLLIRQSAKGVQTFIDVGAHYGFFATIVGLSNPDCRILAFEPVPENAEIMRKNLLLNGVNADVHQAAVSDTSGQGEFQISEASDNSGFVANPAAMVVRSLQTEVVRLDQFIDHIAAGPLLVKIDVQGNELKVLEGMRRIIDERKDVRLVIEFNPRCLEANGATPEALLDALDRLGFDVYFVLDSERKYAKFHRGNNWNDYVGDKTYRNIYCAKKDLSLNLCLFGHSGGIWGAEMRLLELIDDMTKRYGTIFTVVLPHEGPLKRSIEALGAATMTLDYYWWCSHAPRDEEAVAKDLMLTSLASVEDALPVLFELSPDVVLTNTLVIPWGAVAAMRLNRPHVWWVHEFGERDRGLSFYQPFNKTLEIVKESANHVVVNTETVKTALCAGIGSEKCSVAMNRVTLKPPVENAEEYFRYSDSIKVVMAGYVRESSGQHDAVRAVIRLLHDRDDLELCVVGLTLPESAYCRELRELVREEGMEDRIHFVDFLENVRPVMEQAQISLVCSKSEAFGRTTAESMLLERPVIGTSVGGTAELIEDGVNGFLYPPGDAEQLANRIAFFADRPETIGEFGQRARLAILGKLATDPIDSRVYELCHRYKKERNPHSAQLTRLLLRWRRELEERPGGRGRAAMLWWVEAKRLQAELDEQSARFEEQSARMESTIEYQSAQLANVYACTSWRLTAPLRKIGEATQQARRSVGRLTNALSLGPKD